MSTPAISASPTQQPLEAFFQTRQAGLAQLGTALQSGDLAALRQAFDGIVTLGQNGPFKNSEPFSISQREQDFSAIGQALQSGDLAGTRQVFAALRETFRHRPATDPPSSEPVAAPTGSAVNVVS
jgi:hypothetical protein